MFTKKFFLLLISLSFVIYSQVDALKQLRNNPNYEVTVNKDSSVEIYNKQKNFRYLRTIKQLPKNKNKTQADLTIILDTVNFAGYENLYRKWGGIPAVNFWYGKYTSIDANENGKNEIYVYHPYFENNGAHSSIRIYEQDYDSIYSIVYEFPDDTLGAIFDLGDITGDGFLDILVRGFENRMYFFNQETSNSYINNPNFIYHPFPPVFQPNNVTFYDIDGDGSLEIIYYIFAGDGDSLWAYSNHVAKYNPQINNYELIYYNRPQPDYYTNGISIGDFDQDGKGNFATGSVDGKFYIYEFVQETEYQVEFTKDLETANAYLTTFTEDMDGNGRPEIWIGGDIGGVTRLYAFEAVTLGVYEQVYQIDIIGLGSFIDGKMRYVDLDGDGKKEIFLTNANLAFGFKYNGEGNYYMDFVIKAPEFDSTYVIQSLEEIDIADLDNDGIVEIIPQYRLSKGGYESWESIFLKRDKIVSVNEEENNLPNDFELFQNFPNPFNPETKIKFSLPSVSEIKMNIYDILGKEIKKLISETRSSGEYEITWYGTDNSGNKVPSGIYFITMEAESFRKTIKSVFLK